MQQETWLVTGAAGQLGAHLCRRLARTVPEASLVGVYRQSAPSVARGMQLDLTDADRLASAVRATRPHFILHTAAVTAVSVVSADVVGAHRLNVGVTVQLAELAQECGALLVFCSTDMVFDGERAPYREVDGPAPLSAYGRSKAEAERALQGRENVLTVRMPLLYGMPAEPRRTTFVDQVEALRAGAALRLFTDEFRTPLALIDAARALISAARLRLTGLLHLAGPERLSRMELVQRAARLLALSEGSLVAISRLEAPGEPRPRDLSLLCERMKRELPAHDWPRPMRLGAVLSEPGDEPA